MKPSKPDPVAVNLDPEHVDRLYGVLHAAGFGGMTISALHLGPAEDDGGDGHDCQAVLQADGKTYKIECK